MGMMAEADTGEYFQYSQSQVCNLRCGMPIVCSPRTSLPTLPLPVNVTSWRGAFNSPIASSLLSLHTRVNYATALLHDLSSTVCTFTSRTTARCPPFPAQATQGLDDGLDDVEEERRKPKLLARLIPIQGECGWVDVAHAASVVHYDSCSLTPQPVHNPPRKLPTAPTPVPSHTNHLFGVYVMSPLAILFF
jgi:hypothetical protein